MSQVGDVYELGAWVRTDTERALARAELARIFAHTAAVNGVVFGRLEFIELPPGHDRAPEPPADRKGCFYYVGTAGVVGTAPAKSRLAETLDARTRETCRQIVRRHHAAANPGEPTLPDERADAAIDTLGPAAIEDMLRCRPAS